MPPTVCMWSENYDQHYHHHTCAGIPREIPRVLSAPAFIGSTGYRGCAIASNQIPRPAQDHSKGKTCQSLPHIVGSRYFLYHCLVGISSRSPLDYCFSFLSVSFSCTRRDTGITRTSPPLLFAQQEAPRDSPLSLDLLTYSDLKIKRTRWRIRPSTSLHGLEPRRYAE